ncbi:hypothetical protein H0H87_012321 [Tephrocybe sp. NHM501043]|nr:hypothetical protein H0H87_012321 [Tephrocybe sp. NHM501043]
MENYLYDTVTLSSPKLCTGFLYAIQCRPEGFFSETVKSLCIPADIDANQALQILTVCQGVINLAYWISGPPDLPQSISKSHFSAISSLRPNRLSINAAGLFGSSKPPDLTHTFFSRVTHLEIVDWPYPAISKFELLPSLTHLALDLQGYDEETVREICCILKSCNQLRALLCLVEDEATMINAASAFALLDKDFDRRLVILSEPDGMGSWEDSLHGNPESCQWTFAEALIADKQNGAIQFDIIQPRLENKERYAMGVDNKYVWRWKLCLDTSEWGLRSTEDLYSLTLSSFIHALSLPPHPSYLSFLFVPRTRALMDLNMDVMATPRAVGGNDTALTQYFGGAPIAGVTDAMLSWREADHHYGLTLFNPPSLDAWPEESSHKYVDVNHPIVVDDREVDRRSDHSTTTDSDSRGSSSNTLSTGSLPPNGLSSYSQDPDWENFPVTVTYSPHGQTEFIPAMDSTASLFALIDHDHVSNPFFLNPSSDVLSPTISPATFNEARSHERSVGQIRAHPHPDSPPLSASLCDRPCISISELNAPYIPNINESATRELAVLSSSEAASSDQPSRKRPRSITSQRRDRAPSRPRRRAAQLTTTPIMSSSRSRRRAPSFTSLSSSELSDSPPISKRPRFLPEKTKEEDITLQHGEDNDGEESDVTDSDAYSPSCSPSVDTESDYSESASLSLPHVSRKPTKKSILKMSAADALAQLSGSTSSAMSLDPVGEWVPTDSSGLTLSRRNRPIPVPVPVPHLIKKSRGRKVPYVNTRVARGLPVEDPIYDGDDDGNAGRGSSRPGRGRGGGRSGSGRSFVCTVEGCGKCFIRGEHLKRHIRSIHTNDKHKITIEDEVLFFGSPTSANSVQFKPPVLSETSCNHGFDRPPIRRI